MTPSSLNPFHLPNGKPKTVIVNGGAGAIGAETVRSYHSYGCNVVIADLPYAQDAANNLIGALGDGGRAMYHPSDTTDWENMQSLFRETKKRFGQIDIVVANAGLMESKGFFEFKEDSQEELEEPAEAYKVIDVNVKGTMNTLRLAMHSTSSSPPDADGCRGSIVLISSVAGYFGKSGVVAYIASKHGVIGLMRASQARASELGVRLNAIAPSFTPSHMTAGFSAQWEKKGLPANSVGDLARTIVEASTNPERKGHGILIAGSFVKEIETARAALTKELLGEDISGVMAKSGKFFDETGGYTLPEARQ